jgi:hypothetical protein
MLRVFRGAITLQPLSNRYHICRTVGHCWSFSGGHKSNNAHFDGGTDVKRKGHPRRLLLSCKVKGNAVFCKVKGNAVLEC